MRILFLCSRNQWRSPTAERVCAHWEGVEARGRGLSASAVRRVSGADVEWADVILAMEAKHKSQLMQRYRNEVGDRSVHVLDIPDEYQFMDPELVTLIQAAVRPLLRSR